MDENKSSGKSIKAIASWLSALQVIPTLILGLLIMVKLEQVWLGFFVMLVGFVLAFVPYTMLCAFAELVDNSHETVRIEKNMRDLTERNRQNMDLIVRYLAAMSPTETNEAKSEPPAQASELVSAVQDEPTHTKERYTAVDENTWMCNACGRKQRAGRTLCWSCGASFFEVVDTQIISELMSLRAQGLISEEEYKQEILKSGADTSDH